MNRTSYQKLVSTVTVSGEIVSASKVVVRPAKGETETERNARLKYQGGQNHIKARRQDDGSYLVSSQAKPACRQTRRAQHNVTQDAAGRWHCDCEWHSYHPGSACTHILQVTEQIEREAKAQRVEQVIAQAAANFKASRRRDREEEV